MAKSKDEGGGLITLEALQGKYPVLAPESEAALLLRENLAGEGLSVGDLERVKVPSGGGLLWTVSDIEEGEKQVKALEGIILHVARRRAYWANPSPTGDIPDCSSTDCITGRGDPGGLCCDCPFNVFGSAVKPDGTQGRGKACKEVTLLFLLQSDCTLPQVVSVPPGSLKAVKNYRLRLKVPYYAGMTRLELERTNNRDGVQFARIKPTFLGVLPREVAEQVKAYAQTLSDVFNQVTIDRDAAEGGEEE